MLHLLSSVYLKMLVLYSPFFVLSCFISLSRGYSRKEQKRLAWKVALATLLSSVLLYLFGRVIFDVFGITVDAFRIGAGSVLFISALGMAQGKSAVQTDNVQQDVSIVPLTIPITVGPGTIGALLVMGVSQPHWDDKILALLGIALASFTVGLVLFMANRIERLLGDQGLQIVSRLMGLFVCALAAQIIFTGIRGYLVTG
ncbi:MarC family protein [Pseudomonas sp. DTU_2021_1001937_2_SI_NGA_ILE_001]|uniref:MarC family protein n=1 Tax=Pseudomonas sp. DTU_2021_1001937_2_SI_NGA_ILE_001 TaxID=3077589 RepID=UPI0025E7B1FA|nr:MarC family protein [Pseudomonas sp. DTU_2021_1001937_2_SI_NGA_ILE_001]WNW13177.1 MarC family protein [Pseudomonas sp. DTU_2021_1001937_2_SI_NGA_ILE_001]